MRGSNFKRWSLSTILWTVVLMEVVIPGRVRFEVDARVIDLVEDVGLVAEDDTFATATSNTYMMNRTFDNRTGLVTLRPGDVVVIPNQTFHFIGGIMMYWLANITIVIDGTMHFGSDAWDLPYVWPTDSSGNVEDCIRVENVVGFTVTSTLGTPGSNFGDKGVLNGWGHRWWGIPGIGYLVHGERRPKLLTMHRANNSVVEHVLFKNSPYWSFELSVAYQVTIRYTNVDVRRTRYDGHDEIDLTAFNTDGFDVNGQHVHIHDCDIWNQDDSIAVKQSAEHMLFERINASGIGLTIGSIGGTTVNNITFRDCYMRNTYKGVYMKFMETNSPGMISNVTYENIVIDNPEQWAIWIGPAQQSDSSRPCAAHPCSLCWPQWPAAKCYAPSTGTYENILLRNITINNPKTSPGVILGNETNPQRNVTFEDVVVNNPGDKPWGDDYWWCQNVEGVATGRTWPVPPWCVWGRPHDELRTRHHLTT